MRMASSGIGPGAVASGKIHAHTQCLNEINLLGQTPFQLALRNPGCLKLLVDSAPKSLLREVNQYSQLIEEAIFYKNVDSLHILLDIPLRIPRWIPQRATIRVQVVLLDELKRRYDQLKVLGLKHLPIGLINELQLDSDKTPDLHAYLTQISLRDRGIAIPGDQNDEWDDPSSLYHVATTLSARETLWAHGFRDIDTLNKMGMTPVQRCSILSRGHACDLAAWFIDHGADIWTPLYMRRGFLRQPQSPDPLTPAHFLMGIMGMEEDIQDYRTVRLSNMKRVFRACMAETPEDSCTCFCSAGGCKPLGIFLSLFCLYDHFYRLEPNFYDVPVLEPEDISRKFLDFIGRVEPEFSKAEFFEAIRVFTFHSLGVQHTCCAPRVFNKNRNLFEDEEPNPPREEVDEINEEQADLLQVLEKLVGDLSEVFLQDKGGEHFGLANPDEFWNHEWAPRVTEAVRKLDEYEMTDDEKQDAEKVGVVWHGPKLPEKDKMTFDDFREQIEEIVRNA
jgi:hypothetical protein